MRAAIFQMTTGIDPAANAANARLIGRAESRIAAFVIPTDEEQVIAEETAALLAEPQD